MSDGNFLLIGLYDRAPTQWVCKPTTGIGREMENTTTKILFVMVDTPAWYNTILERMTLSPKKFITSTIH